jgi:hypothetical protein
MTIPHCATMMASFQRISGSGYGLSGDCWASGQPTGDWIEQRGVSIWSYAGTQLSSQQRLWQYRPS